MSGGGWLADRLSKRSPKALFYVSGASILLAVPAIMLALHSESVAAIVRLALRLTSLAVHEYRPDERGDRQRRRPQHEGDGLCDHDLRHPLPRRRLVPLADGASSPNTAAGPT